MIDFEKDMKIDEEALDLELLNQAKLEAKYIGAVSEAFKDLRYAQENVKTIRSELIVKANKYPERCCNKPKPTAGDIEAYYRTHKKYKRIKKEAIDAEDRYNVLKDMKDDVHFTRTKALEGLVELLKQEYFAGPRMPRDLYSSKKNWHKEKKIGSKMKRRMKRKV